MHLEHCCCGSKENTARLATRETPKLLQNQPHPPNSLAVTACQIRYLSDAVLSHRLSDQFAVNRRSHEAALRDSALSSHGLSGAMPDHFLLYARKATGQQFLEMSIPDAVDRRFRNTKTHLDKMIGRGNGRLLQPGALLGSRVTLRRRGHRFEDCWMQFPAVAAGDLQSPTVPATPCCMCRQRISSEDALTSTRGETRAVKMDPKASKRKDFVEL